MMKSNWKRLLSGLLCVLMILVSVSMPSYAAEAEEGVIETSEGGYKWPAGESEDTPVADLESAQDQEPASIEVEAPVDDTAVDLVNAQNQEPISIEMEVPVDDTAVEDAAVMEADAAEENVTEERSAEKLPAEDPISMNPVGDAVTITLHDFEANVVEEMESFDGTSKEEDAQLLTQMPLEADDQSEEQLLPEARGGDEEIFETITFVPDAEAYHPENDGISNDELFAGYVQGLLNEPLGRDGLLLNGVRDAGAWLTGPELKAYNYLSSLIIQVADGQLANTGFKLPANALGFTDLGPWTAADLGVEAIVRNGAITQEAMDAAARKVNWDFSKVIEALLADHPYALYWYDKTASAILTSYYYSASGNGNGYTLRFVSESGEDEVYQYLYMPVAWEFAASEYAMDASKVVRAKTARDNARSIARKYVGRSMVDQMKGFKREICNMVSYDYGAAFESSRPYGDPWQLINVFDGNSSTNVVCEGYAKAFKYLCDLNDIPCITVSGIMSEGGSGGSHMWNIVNLDDGRNYLVDITNCDDNGIGAPDRLFMAYTNSETWDRYTIRLFSSSVMYVYDSGTKSTYARERLTLSKYAYGSVATREGLHLDEDGRWRFYVNDVFDETKTGLVDFEGGRFFIANGVLCTEASGLNLYAGTWYFLANGQIQNHYTGLALYDGWWFYITKGILDTSKRGLVPYDGSLFLVADGQILHNVNGLWYDSFDTFAWYLILDGQVATYYSGRLLYNGQWLILENGKLVR